MDLGLKGKFALVTGGSHGIGLATARALADEGCHVAICARNQERIAGAVKDLEHRGVQTIGVQADVLDPSAIDRTVKTVADTWGAIHVLVNNVGGGGRWGKPSFEETAEAVWSDVYNKNAMAAIRFTRLAIPFMRRQRWGRVVTISSIFGREAGGRPWYAVAKSAEITLMKVLANDRELVRDGITFNSVAPGPIMIHGTGTEDEQAADPVRFSQWVDANFPLGRLGTPEEVASVVVFVCSEQASLVNGACLAVDGGESRSL